MKRQALLNLIDRMKNDVDDAHFNMALWLFPVGLPYTNIEFKREEDIPYCKTGGCLAGEVFLGLTPEQRAEYKKEANARGHDPAYTAGVAELGLNAVEADVLFSPSAVSSMRKWTRVQAIQVLEHIRDHRVIDWGRVVGRASCFKEPLPIEFID